MPISLRRRLSPENIKNLLHLSHEFSWIAAGQGAALIGGVLGVRLLTGAMSPEDYGILALSITIATLFQQIILSPIAVAALRFFAPANESHQLCSFLHGVRRLVSGASFLSLALTFSFIGVAYWLGFGKWFFLILGALVFSLLTGYSIVLDGIQNAARNRAIVAWHQALGQWLRFAAALVLIRWYEPAGTAAIWGYALGAAFVFISQYLFFQRKIERTAKAENTATNVQVQTQMSEMTRYGWPFAAWGLFAWAQMTSDRWALQMFWGAKEVGLYAALYQIGYYPVSLMSAWIVQLVTPILFAKAGEGSDPKRTLKAKDVNNRLVVAAVAMILPAVALAFCFHSFIFRLFVAPQYHSASGLLPWMILASGLFACSQMAVSSLLCLAESRVLIFPKVATSLLGIILNIAGAYWGGLQGIVWAGVLFAFVYFVWIVCLTHPFKFIFKNVLRQWA
jgi:O-antigen/teichoic acid export membrane protein